MADRIKNTQIRHTKDRFINTGVREDVLAPSQHSSVSHAVAPEWRKITAVGTASFGETVIFDLPKTQYLSELVVEFNLAAQSVGAYTRYVAMSAIRKVNLLSQSGNELHSYHYRPVMSGIMARMHGAPRNVLTRAAGDLAHVSGKVAAIIPYFGSRLAHREMDMPPLPVHLLDGKLRLELELETAANLAGGGASGDGVISQMRLWVKEYQVEDEQRSLHQQGKSSYVYKSVDWQTNINNAVPAATDTEIDISGFHGSVHSLYFPFNTDTDLASNLYFSLSPLDRVEVRADGDILYNSDNSSELPRILHSYLNNGTIADTLTSGGRVLDNVSFGYANWARSNSYSGSLSLNDVNQFDVVVNSATAGQQALVGEFDVEYVINASGEIRRMR